MANGDLIAVGNVAGTDLFRVTSTGAVSVPAGVAVSTDVISEKTAATGVTVDSVLLKDGIVTVGTGGSVVTDTISEKTAATGVDVDGCLIKDGRAEALATAAFFLSAETTGSGSEQDHAHLFGAAPTLAFAVVTEAPAALGSGLDIAHGTHDATNAKFTVTSGIKYRVVAFK